MPFFPVGAALPTPSDQRSRPADVFVGASVVGTRPAHWAAWGNTTTGNSQNTRIRHKITVTATDLRLSYAAITGATGVDAPTPEALTVRAAIEYPLGVFYPVFFNGKRDIVIEPGAMVTSDPVGIRAIAGDFVYSRTFVTVSPTGAVPVMRATASGDQEAVEGGTGLVDRTTGTTIPFVGVQGYAPLALLGNPVDKTVRSKCIGIIGDSISNGSLEDDKDLGYIVRALANANLPWLHMSKGGETAQIWLDQSVTHRRRRLIAPCSHAIVEYGTNDVYGSSRTVAQIQADLTAIWTALNDRGIKVFQTTITPQTTSTDSWATTANQTINSAKNTVRVTVNDWIRTVPAPLAGYFDAADAAESARNSGLWNPGFTPDGIHPNTTGGTVMTAKVATANLT